MCLETDEITDIYCDGKSHLGCLGAFIVIVSHGFETFSQQMVLFEQRPRQLVNESYSPAPAPARSEV